MDNIFNKGDKVVMIENEENAKYERFYGIEMEVIGYKEDYGQQYIKVMCEKIVRTFYPKRIQLVKPKAIIVGCIVKAVKDVGVSVGKSKEYVVQGLKDDKIKLLGVGNWLKLEYFVYSQSALVAKPIVEMNEGEKLLKELNDKVAGNAGTCSYVLQTEKGKKSWHVRDACHARLSTRWRDEVQGVVTHVALNVNGHYVRHPYKEAYKEWVKFIIFESSFKDCFLPTTLDNVLASGVLCNVEKPTSQLVAAAVALRVGSEYPRQCELFKKMLDLGFSSVVSLMTGVFFKEQQVGGKPELSFYDPAGGHHFLKAYLEFDGLVNFWNKGEWNDLKEEPYKLGHKKGYVVCNALTKDAMGDNNLYGKIMKMKGMKMVDHGWGEKGVAVEGANRHVKVGAALARYFD